MALCMDLCVHYYSFAMIPYVVAFGIARLKIPVFMHLYMLC